MKATTTPPTERDVTITMTETEATALAQYLGKLSCTIIERWVALRGDIDDKMAQPIYHATSNTYFAIAEALDL